MDVLPDPDWYLDNVLAYAQPGRSALLSPLPADAWRRWWAAQVSDDPLGRVAAAQGFVLMSGQLARLGVTRSTSRAAVKRGSWTTAGYGAIGVVAVDDGESEPFVVARRRHALAAAAGALRRDAHVVSGRSAAILHGVPTLAVPISPELTDAHTGTMGHRGSHHVFSAALSEASTASWYGIPVTSIARTIVDEARHSRRGGLIALDAALREHLVTPADLALELDAAIGWPGIKQARAIVDLGDGRAESPLESITRLAMHDDGFPPPMLQVAVGPFRLDFYWPEHRLVVEADGEGKYVGDASLREKRREHYLHQRGLRVERVMWRDVTIEWAQTSRRLWAALRSS